MKSREQQFKEADRLKTIRKELGMNQYEFCEALGISDKVKGCQAWYCRVEKGYYPQKGDMIGAAEKLLYHHVLKKRIEIQNELKRLAQLLSDSIK